MEGLNRPVSSDYLRRHGVSAAQLEEWQICAQSDATNPGLSWVEMAEIAAETAFHWNSVDGKLSSYANFVKAVERRAKRELSKRTTAVIRARVADVVEPRHETVGGAHLFVGYEAPEPPVQSEQFRPHDWNGPDDAA